MLIVLSKKNKKNTEKVSLVHSFSKSDRLLRTGRSSGFSYIHILVPTICIILATELWNGVVDGVNLHDILATELWNGLVGGVNLHYTGY